MREVKGGALIGGKLIPFFRGKRIINDEWVVGAVLPHDNNDAVTIFRQHPADGSLERFEVEPSTVGQYTGFTDRNADCIFDDDIIQIRFPEGYKYIGIVRFGAYSTLDRYQSTHFGFYIEWLNLIKDSLRPDFLFWINTYQKSIEVLGNIHDNPELVEGACLQE